MKKHILHTIGLAAMAALLCVVCGDNSTNGSAGGEVNELLSKYNKRGSGITYTVTFDANGGDGAGPDAQSVNAASGLTLPDRGALTKDGFAFGGWNTEADGTGTFYSAGSSYSPTDHSVLYAVWNPLYTVTFHANGGDGTVPSAVTVSAGNSVPLPDGGALTKGDFAFGGWNTEADGTGTFYSAGSSYSPTDHSVLYAVWNSIYTVTFHANGGSGAVPTAATVSAGNSIQLPDGGGMSKGDLVFSGWNTEADGSGATRSAGSSYSPDGNITLYATWRVASTGDGDESSIVLAEGEAWVYNDSGYIFTADNRVFSVFKSDGDWWYRDTTGNYQTSGGGIITINSVAGTYRISGETLLLSRYTSTFTKTSGVNPRTPYYLTLTISGLRGGGSVSKNPDKKVYYFGEQVTVTATANYSYVGFTGWLGALESTSAIITITMNENKNLTANFIVTPFTDSRDNNTYKRVVIGTQVWMGENLNYNASGSKCYGNSDTYCDTYGRLYGWATAMNGASSSSASPSGVQGVCPAGWHLPSDAEWNMLTRLAGATTLKSSQYWTYYEDRYTGTDDWGFSALPGGYVFSDGGFNGVGIYGYWWSATGVQKNEVAWIRGMSNRSEDVFADYAQVMDLLSVRCMMD